MPGHAKNPSYVMKDIDKNQTRIMTGQIIDNINMGEFKFLNFQYKSDYKSEKFSQIKVTNVRPSIAKEICTVPGIITILF